MHRLHAAFVLAYHGCDEEVAERLLKGDPFKPSTNVWDWPGHGIYFWEANPLRGLEFARELSKRPRTRSVVTKPAVVGAILDLGLCLDLTTASGIDRVRIAHEQASRLLALAGVQPPRNDSGGLRRDLDCLVMQTLHRIREEAGETPIASVRGVFVEGTPLYPSSGFHAKTHIQICVRDPGCIRGVFRVPRSDLA